MFIGYFISALLFVIFVFVFGLLLLHLQNIIQNLISPQRNFKAIWEGTVKSKIGIIIALVIMALCLTGAYFYDNEREKIMLVTIRQAVIEANEPLRSDIQILIQEIRQERIERVSSDR